MVKPIDPEKATRRKYPKCEKCGKTFFSEEMLETHKRINGGE